MSLTIANPTTGQTIEGQRRKWRGQITFDSAYPTGGETINLDTLGWSKLEYGTLLSDDGYVGKVDVTNEKAMVYGAATGVLQSISKVCAYGSFTDNAGTATGYIDFTDTLPVGAVVSHWKAVVATGFTGDTTAVVQVGIAGDLDRFSADTAQSVLAAGTVGSAPLAADVCDGISAVVTPRVTVTGAADFTSISAGTMTVTIYYRIPASMRSVSKSCAIASFTDNTNTTGYIDFTSTVPAGAIISHWTAEVTTAFTGDTTATIMVGVSGDTDRFSADTAKSVATASTTVASAPLAADVCDGISAAVTPRVTVTGASDFGLITTGLMTVTVYYTDPADNTAGLAEVPNGADLSAVVMYGELIGY